MPVIYRPTKITETIIILRAVRTTLTITAYGSADDYTTPGTEFGEDEDVMVAGTLIADDLADLTGTELRVFLDGTLVGTVTLNSYDGNANYYQYSLGILTEGTHTVEVRFPRVKR
ncbi:hypothetical protein CH330_01305 [candidate division WOR-3 bacterium JGI_Cruoil_03_51_56]|uniref:Bacterial Ig-like domain-containing protein n=1 Tax=candidate division WOR-3 bacterium JGI_Cruoil_03_51_56 TaxID=1973747 RepID=A0A235BX57_UNCW3|nr:MAG: hypothetical protein CH330_01305 [candidate division WOR-3 bacterium JGI_Cruoil_03_51_56]